MLKESNTRYYRYICTECKENIYSFICQTKCSICNTELIESIIFSPIESPKAKCLVITESFNSLSPFTYSSKNLLHVGISDCKNNIYHFWNNYNIQNYSENPGIWKQVINVSLDAENRIEDWDNLIYINYLHQQLNFPKYHSLENNCFDYACRFLNDLNFQEKVNWDKEVISEKILNYQIFQLDKFCNVFQKLISNEKNGEIEYRECFNDITTEIKYYVCDYCSKMISGEELKYHCDTCEDYDLCVECKVSVGHEHLMKINK